MKDRDNTFVRNRQSAFSTVEEEEDPDEWFKQMFGKGLALGLLLLLVQAVVALGLLAAGLWVCLWVLEQFGVIMIGVALV